MNETGNEKTVCPYFKRETRKGKIGIICEGFDNVDEVAVYFSRAEKKRKYQESFCFCECYKGCPVAQLAEEKWEES